MIGRGVVLGLALWGVEVVVRGWSVGGVGVLRWEGCVCLRVVAGGFSRFL